MYENGLTTVPHFNDGWIDNKVEILFIENPESVIEGEAEDSDHVHGKTLLHVATAATKPEPSLKVSSLASANREVVHVSMDDSLEKAQSLMMRHDFSQLAVMSGQRDLRGAVSCESIAQAKITDPHASLRDCIVRSRAIDSEDDLLVHVPVIVESGYIFVRAHDNRICGIVTTADLSNQFVSLAQPFFLLGEIERRIRRIIDRKFDQDILRSVIDPDRNVEGVVNATNLSIGEYVRLLQNPQHWNRIGWTLDRLVFIDALEDVRRVRNEVMHFSPDPVDPEDINGLERFLRWVRRLDREQ